MALTKVDPNIGIYVEMEGIIEVRYSIGEEHCPNDSEDFFHFQSRVDELPDYFCLKDKETAEQAYFFCLVCNCELKSLRPLRDHVAGKKHIKKAYEKKRQILGLPKEPQNAPRLKLNKKERPRVNVGQRLRQRLEDCGQPALGLEFITEYINPRTDSDHPMYTCRLQGCRSAWGTSDDIFNHCIKPKHLKNFFKKYNPGDSRIDGLSNADILAKAAEYEEELGGSEERDYAVIDIVRDFDKYIELRNRPHDWSEKKGLVGACCNPNFEPLGSGGNGGTSVNKRARLEDTETLLEDEALGGWKMRSKKQLIDDWINGMRNGVTDVVNTVDEFDGKNRDRQYEDIIYYIKMYRDLLSLFDNDEEELVKKVVRSLVAELTEAESKLQEKVEGEDREMKAVSKLMAELEEEVEKYFSERNTKKYKNIRERLKQITKEMKVLEVTSPANVVLSKQYNARLAMLWTEFESRSDSLVEILEHQMGNIAGKSSIYRIHGVGK